MLELNITLLFQIIGFFVLLVILNRFLYRPVQKILDEREERIEGTLKKASDIDKEIEDGLASYEMKIKEATLKGHEQRSKLKAEAEEREREVLERAGTEAAGELASMKKDIRKNKDSALASMKDETRSIARDIAGRLLDRDIALIILVGMATFLPTVAHATEEAENGNGPLIWKAINFAILAAGVYLVWKKVLKPLLEKRSVDIKESIDEAKKVKEEAEIRAAEYRKKLDELETRLEEIQTQLRLDGEAEKQKIIEGATAAAERIRLQAKLAAEQEIKKARIEIRSEVADMAVKMAEELISKEIKPDDQQRLIKDYITRLKLH